MVRLCTCVIVSRPMFFVMVSTTVWHTIPRSARSLNFVTGPCCTARFIWASDCGVCEKTSCSISPSMASSSAATLAAADRFHWEELPNGLAVIGDMICGRHRCRSRVCAGLLHLEHVERNNSDLATEGVPLRATFSMGWRCQANKSG